MTIQLDDLNPSIKEAIEIATDGLSLMEAARLRNEMLTRIEQESLCGIIHSKQVCAIIDSVLVDDIKRLEQRIQEIQAKHEDSVS